ncbi:MAG: hypothetical protein AMXMBFR13_01500 [Phycisphaerae bacterium]
MMKPYAQLWTGVDLMRPIPLWSILAWLAMTVTAVSADRPVASAPATTSSPRDDRPRYRWWPHHDPDGIGKFYMGREIAQVMGHAGAAWLDRPEREEEEHGRKLMTALKLRPGMIVADIGAGSGYYTTRLAKIVGPSGRVKAVDIQPEMLEIIDQKARREKLANIDLVLGSEDDPRLEPASVDLALLVDVYHEFAFPYEMMQQIAKALRPGGRVVLVEFRLEDPLVPIKRLHKMSEAQVIREMRPHPLRHQETLRTLPRQHVIVFEKTTPATRPATPSADDRRSR